MHPYSRSLSIVAMTCGLVAITTGSVLADPPSEKVKITKLDDLPKHTYPATTTVSQMMESREAILELGRKVRTDVEADFAKYEISDRTTLQKMHGHLLSVDLLEENWDNVLKGIETIRGLEDKAAAKLTIGLATHAMIAAKRATAKEDDPAKYRKIYAKELYKAVSALPWDIVQDDIQESKGRLEIYSKNLLLGVVSAQLEPVVAKTGELDADQASSVLGIYYMINERLPLKADTIAVYQRVIDANKVVKKDIWAARSVTLKPGDACKPVLVAAWDSGTDPAIFKDILFVNPHEKPNGKDDDNNGFVDDIHGVAYDIHAKRTSGDLFPLGDAEDRMPKIMKHMKGFMDLQAAVDSAEATAIKKHLSGLEPAAVKDFLEDLGLAGNYSHGTHVAGLMTEGNPFARLLIARHSYDYHLAPVARTEEWGERDGAKCRDTVAYLKENGVRVVNMSWGESQQDAEVSLQKNGIGKDADERRELARKVFAHQKKGLYEAMKNAPEILFVCAAGNSDNDVEFDEYIPSSFKLANLMTVGAVDQAGDPTSFTSTGEVVQVYANGFEVESYVPGGQRMKMSGTSMASPNAANLAAKLLAIDPTLTPAQVIKLIKKSADQKTVGGHSFLLMNPKNAVKLLKDK